MSCRHLYSAACLLFVAATTAPSTRPASPPAMAPAALPADFAPLLERSIFERGRPVSRGPSATTQPTAATPESIKVLNGVTKVNGQLMAFVEDRTTGKISAFRVNDPIARGKVLAITLDALTYEADGKTTRVDVGDNLTGQPANPPTTAPTAGDQGASGSAQSVLERLRQRRQQELKQK